MSTKRILALVLIALLTFTALVSCAPKTDPDDGPDKKDPIPPEETVDYGNEAFYFLGGCFPKAWRDYSEEEKEEAGGSAPVYGILQEAMMNKILQTERKYNCRIIKASYPAYDSASLISFFTTGTEMDFIYQTSSVMRDLYFGEVIADINDIEAIDLTDSNKWGSAFNLEMVQYQGHQFGIPYTNGLYWPGLSTSFYGAFLQSNVAMDFYKDDIDWTVPQLVESGDWTWSTFLNIMPTVSVETTDEKASKHAISFLDGSWPYLAALYVNEGSFVEYNAETGKYEYGLLSDAAIEAMEFCREMYATEGFDTDGMQWAEIERINNGDYTFFLTSTNRAFDQIAKLTSEVSWIPFPYGPHSIYGESTCAYNNESRDCVIGIFEGGLYDLDQDEEKQRNGVIFNDMYDPTEEFGVDGYDDYMLHNVFADDNGMSLKYYKQYGNRIANSWSDVIGGNVRDSVKNKMSALMFVPTMSIYDTLSMFEAPINNTLDLAFGQ